MIRPNLSSRAFETIIMARSSNSSSRHRLANQILEVIRDARFEPGHHMREQQLSDLLGVSRTPVRAALALLAEQGIVEARRHQGFFLLVPFNDLHRTEIEVPSSVEQDLYERLVRDRLAGKLPASLTQSEIGQRYNVDRLAMLRTLARLAEDGLVARNKGHGWSFLPALDTHFALRSSYDFRLTIEPAAFLLGTFKADAAALKRVRLQHMYLVSHPDIASVGSAQLFRHRCRLPRNHGRVQQQHLPHSGRPAAEPAAAPARVRRIWQSPAGHGLVPRASGDHRCRLGGRPRHGGAADARSPVARLLVPRRT